jgi:transposase
MTYITGHDRSQLLLLPEAVDDYVGWDNPVRFIDAFVDGLDLAAAGFGRVAPKVTGRPAYAPGDLLKLYIYRYLNGLVVISVPKVTLRKLLYINGLSDKAQRNSLRPQRSLLS